MLRKSVVGGDLVLGSFISNGLKTVFSKTVFSKTVLSDPRRLRRWRNNRNEPKIADTPVSFG